MALDSHFEDLIYEDVKDIKNSGSKTQRIRSLQSYYNNPNYCKQCGKVIEVQTGKKVKDAKKKVFCNKSCSAKYHNALLDSSIRRGPLPYAVTCPDEEFIVFYKESSTIEELCSKLGYKYAGTGSNQVKKRMSKLGLDTYELKRKNKRSIASRTKDELISKSKYWVGWRNLVQAHARKVFNRSDKPKECQICGYNLTYEVAHIKPVSSFDGDATVAEINDIDNLIALCPNHHWEYDHDLIDIADYK